LAISSPHVRTLSNASAMLFVRWTGYRAAY